MCLKNHYFGENSHLIQCLSSLTLFALETAMVWVGESRTCPSILSNPDTPCKSFWRNVERNTWSACHWARLVCYPQGCWNTPNHSWCCDMVFFFTLFLPVSDVAQFAAGGSGANEEASQVWRRPDVTFLGRAVSVKHRVVDDHVVTICLVAVRRRRSPWALHDKVSVPHRRRTQNWNIKYIRKHSTQ